MTLIVRSSKGANVHRAPNLIADVLNVLADGTLVPVVGRLEDNKWFLIRLSDDRSGWISKLVVDLIGDAEGISIAETSK
jgi:hypothetical protein